MSGVLLGAVLAAAATQSTWHAPEHPDPSAILAEARKDARAKRYEAALTKHEWLLRESLAHDPAFAGVRLSFALGEWVELGRSYAPALASLRRFRDEAQQRVLGGSGAVPDFQELASINRYLGEEPRTRDAFLKLDREGPELAAKVYELAEPALIAAKDYATCGRYLRPEIRWKRMVELRAMNRKRPEYATFAPLRDFDRQSFTYGSAVVVALLALNGRADEAKQMADTARAEWDDPAFQRTIAAALEGTLPARFP